MISMNASTFADFRMKHRDAMSLDISEILNTQGLMGRIGSIGVFVDESIDDGKHLSVGDIPEEVKEMLDKFKEKL